MMNHLRIERFAELGRAPPFGVQDLRDLRACAAFAAQLHSPRGRGRISAQRGQARDGTRQRVGSAHAAMPVTFDPNLFRVADDLDQNPFEQQPILFHCIDDVGQPRIGPLRAGAETRAFAREAWRDIAPAIVSMREY